MTQWVKVDPAVAPGGHVGGDVQATESYSVRFLPEAMSSKYCRFKVK